ncbi:MAG: DUF2497 domain-containing protein [Hydrotalea sp.]|nr:DUF2497 domain-containing protein [Hydrotalea sp.]
MTDIKNQAPQYFRREENYIGDDKPIILVDGPGNEMDSVIDISDRMPQPRATDNDADNCVKEIITATRASGQNYDQDLIGDEWLNGSNIVSDRARAVSEDAINQVRQAIQDRRLGNGVVGVAMGRGGVTIEQIVRESVRPYLKTWVDHNLETIVKEVMRRELARLG